MMGFRWLAMKKGYEYLFQVDGRRVYVYGRKTNLEQKSKQLPLVLDLNCTTGNPQAEAMTNGWKDLAQKENMIVVAPEYDDYATYSETTFFMHVIQAAERRYHIDEHRIYSVGFSNGGASSVALANTYPHLLAGIGAMGWMIGYARNKNVEIPFVLIQGSKEYIDHLGGKTAVMDDEKVALRDLFTGNRMIDTQKADYQKYPYWGYKPDRVYQRAVTYFDYDPYGHDKRQVRNKLIFSEYLRKGFKYPFARLVLVPKETHIPHSSNAKIVWDGLKHFQRVDDKITEK